MDNKRRLAYLSFGKFPSVTAHSVHIVNMCQALSEIGWDVTLIADIREDREKIISHYGIKTPFKLVSVPLKNIRFLGRMWALKKISSYLRRETFDVLYTRDIFNGRLAASTNLPFYFELHELPTNRIRRGLLKSLLKSPGLNKFVFISNKMELLFQEEYRHQLPSSCVAHDGVDLVNFHVDVPKTELREELGFSPSGFIAGYTGSLFPGRGVEVILDMAQKRPETTFVIVGGEGRFFDELRTSRKISSLNNLILTGYVPYRSIPKYLAAFDVLLMPYQKHVLHRQVKHDTVKYMSPLKMFEYMASGRPIVSSSLPVLKEVLKDQYNALLVTPDNIVAWDEALNKIMTNPGLAESLAKHALEDVRRYTWKARALNIMRG